MIPNLADEAHAVAAMLPAASPDEVLLVTRCRCAIRKVDHRGQRGAEMVTASEIIAMVTMLAICGGPIMSSAADHKPEVGA